MSPAKVKYNRQISGSPSGVELFDFFQEATLDPQSVINQDQGSIESSFSNKALGFLVGSDWSSEHHTAQKLDFVGPAEDASELFKLGGTGTHILSINQISDDFDPPKCDIIEWSQEMLLSDNDQAKTHKGRSLPDIGLLAEGRSVFGEPRSVKDKGSAKTRPPALGPGKCFLLQKQCNVKLQGIHVAMLTTARKRPTPKRKRSQQHPSYRRSYLESRAGRRTRPTSPHVPRATQNSRTYRHQFLQRIGGRCAHTMRTLVMLKGQGRMRAGGRVSSTRAFQGSFFHPQRGGTMSGSRRASYPNEDNAAARLNHLTSHTSPCAPELNGNDAVGGLGAGAGHFQGGGVGLGNEAGHIEEWGREGDTGEGSGEGEDAGDDQEEDDA